MKPTVKGRRKIMSQFHLCYNDLCKTQGMMPLAAVMAHQKKKVLHLNGDRLTYEEWVPVLHALSLDNSLRSISVRSMRAAKIGNSVYAQYAYTYAGKGCELIFSLPFKHPYHCLGSSVMAHNCNRTLLLNRLHVPP